MTRRLRSVAARSLILLTLVDACSSRTAHLDVGVPPPGVTVNAHVQYYDVTAASLTELQRAMRQLGPRWEGRSYQAVTQSQFHWTFQVATRGSACELRRARVNVQTVVTFPRWSPSAEPDSVLMEWWRQLNAGLVEHERGHALLSVGAAGEIVRALDGMTDVRCDALRTHANVAANQLVRLSQRKQVEYDVATRHGATQVQQAGRLYNP